MIDFSDFASAERVFHFFLEISKIPRGSGNTAAIAEYLVNFANERGLSVMRDGADNVVIRKPATKGYEGRPGIILQGHTDIVAVKTPESTIDLEKDGLDVYRDGDFLRARGTSLGGDDGVAVAYALAILDADDIPHPEFEAVFTSDEEIGLLGATALEASAIRGRMMINIDSDEEGIFTVGCAGGIRVDLSLPAIRETSTGAFYKIAIQGLLGGHSGIDIDKGRANAIKILAEILAKFGDVRIASISGGVADNAIPTEAEAIIATGASVVTAFEKARADILEKWQDTESGLDISITEAEPSPTVFDKHTTESALALILDEPSGVIAMSEDIPGLVETSLNLGLLSSNDNEVALGFSIRSAKNSAKDALISLVEKTAAGFGASSEKRGAYPAWEYRKNSPLRDKMYEIYEKMYGRVPKVVTIHAGLECGIFSDKLEGLDCVSLGPDNRDIHTTGEHLSISSTARVYEYLIEILKNI